MFDTENFGLATRKIDRRFIRRMLPFTHSYRTMHHYSPPFFPLFRKTAAAAFLAGFSILLLQTFAVAQGDDSTDAVAVFNEAQDLHEKGDLAGAIALYEKALKIVPEFPEAAYQRGVAKLSLC